MDGLKMLEVVIPAIIAVFGGGALFTYLIDRKKTNMEAQKQENVTQQQLIQNIYAEITRQQGEIGKLENKVEHMENERENMLDELEQIKVAYAQMRVENAELRKENQFLKVRLEELTNKKEG
jgi:predicted RNase H-like nuclease (RuvC/YqgF family)